jgi:hypothetical protein
MDNAVFHHRALGAEKLTRVARFGNVRELVGRVDDVARQIGEAAAEIERRMSQEGPATSRARGTAVLECRPVASTLNGFRPCRRCPRITRTAR